MRQIFKILKSRLAIFTLTIFAEVWISAHLIDVLGEQYYIEWGNIKFSLRYLWFVLDFFLILHLINRDMLPDCKMPWLLFILICPFVGAVSYILFSHNKIPRWQQKLYKIVAFDTQKNIPSSEEHASLTNLFDPIPRQQCNYIWQTSGLPVYGGTATKYYPDGELFWEDVCNDLKKAKKFIFLEYFIIEEGVMWNRMVDILREKVEQGVEVRLLFDDIGCASTMPRNYLKLLRGLGIEFRKFNPYNPWLSAMHNNRDHRKILVIDGSIGYTGGINLDDKYINRIQPFGYWKDSAIRLEGAAVKNLTLLFLQSYCVMNKETEGFDNYLENIDVPIFKNQGFVQPFGDGPRPLYQEMVNENVYLNLINQAKNYVWIMTPYLIIDHALLEALRRAGERGVDVRIITPHIPDKKIIFALTRSNYRPLLKSGVKIYEFSPGFIHSKNILCDDELGTIGTANLDYRSLIHHYEDTVWLYKTPALQDLKKDFEKTFEDSELKTLKTAHLGFFKGVLCATLNLFTPLL